MNQLHQVLVAAFFLTSCVTAGTTADATCVSSGQRWNGGNEGSPEMNPGKACITCHTSGGEGPKYAVAGTVYSDGSDTDGCNGVAGVSVELIPVGPGNPVTLTTNSAGNFFASANQMFAGKYTARVIQNGKARVMTTPQTNGDCNSCHTLDGSGGAPGRVMTPSL